jgi:hypothetical protein
MMTAYTPIYNLPYVEASDLVASYPTVSEELAENVETAISGSGGMTLIDEESFSAVSSVSLNNVFSATYQNYLVIATWVNSTSAENYLRLRKAGTDSTSNYDIRAGYLQSAYSANTQVANIRLGDNGTQKAHVTVNLSDVAKAAATSIFALGNDAAASSVFVAGGVHTAATAYDGCSLLPSTGTITGTVRVYGYKGA